MDYTCADCNKCWKVCSIANDKGKMTIYDKGEMVIETSDCPRYKWIQQLGYNECPTFNISEAPDINGCSGFERRA